MIHDCYIHNNGEQAVFIEQGTQYSLVTGNMLGPGNQNGLSFYNNLFSPTVNGHVISQNDMGGNRAAGINIGSIRFYGCYVY